MNARQRPIKRNDVLVFRAPARAGVSPAGCIDNEYGLRPRACSVCVTNGRRHAVRTPVSRVPRGGPACRRPVASVTNMAFGRRPVPFASRTDGDTPSLPVVSVTNAAFGHGLIRFASRTDGDTPSLPVVSVTNAAFGHGLAPFTSPTDGDTPFERPYPVCLGEGRRVAGRLHR